MRTTRVVKQETNRINLPTFLEVVSEYSFDKKDKVFEIELIDAQISLISEKLITQGSSLQKTTISKLMDIASKLTMKKEILLGDWNFSNKPLGRSEDNPAWRLHKKSQSGFEKKAE